MLAPTITVVSPPRPIHVYAKRFRGAAR